MADETTPTPEQTAAIENLRVAMGAYGEALSACATVGLDPMAAMGSIIRDEGGEINPTQAMLLGL